MGKRLPLCACGCGGRVSKPGNKWIVGHNAKSEHPRGMLGKTSTRKLERMSVKCKQCGDIFYVLPKSEQIFCSQDCHYEWISKNINGKDAPHWKGGKVTVFCEYCGGEITDWESQLQTHNFCSKSCYDKWQNEEENKKEMAILISCGMQGILREEWNGFIKNEKYCIKFNNECRKYNRLKYNNKCYICGLLESENITSTGKLRLLSVHHIDMNKNQGCDDIDWKLVPVCIHCHNKLHNDVWKDRILWLLKNV